MCGQVKLCFCVLYLLRWLLAPFSPSPHIIVCLFGNLFSFLCHSMVSIVCCQCITNEAYIAKSVENLCKKRKKVEMKKHNRALVRELVARLNNISCVFTLHCGEKISGNIFECVVVFVFLLSSHLAHSFSQRFLFLRFRHILCVL